jgi:hypothetical protein
VNRVCVGWLFDHLLASNNSSERAVSLAAGCARRASSMMRSRHGIHGFRAPARLNRQAPIRRDAAIGNVIDDHR